MKYKKIAQELNTNSLIVASFLKGNERTTLNSEQLLKLLEIYKQEYGRVKGLVIAKLEQRKEVDYLLKVKQDKIISNKDIEKALQ
jgi:hypothetical protein